MLPQTQTPPKLAEKHERTGHAKEVAGGQESYHDKSAPISPRQHPGEIGGTDLRTKQSVNNHGDGNNEQHRLHETAAGLRAEERAAVPPAHQKRTKICTTGYGVPGSEMQKKPAVRN